MQDLEEMIERLLETARKLPPGPERQDALKEVGRFRVRLDAISKKSNSLSESSPTQPTGKGRNSARSPACLAVFSNPLASVRPLPLPDTKGT